jgi:hypothetical protein
VRLLSWLFDRIDASPRGPFREDRLPEAAPLGAEHVDLGSCDVYDLLRAINEAFPADAVLRVQEPSGEVQELLEARAPAASYPQYDVPLGHPLFADFLALADRSADPEIGIHLFVHRDGRMLEAHDCALDTWITSDLPVEALSRLPKRSVRDGN